LYAKPIKLPLAGVAQWRDFDLATLHDWPIVVEELAARARGWAAAGAALRRANVDFGEADIVDYDAAALPGKGVHAATTLFRPSCHSPAPSRWSYNPSMRIAAPAVLLLLVSTPAAAQTRIHAIVAIETKGGCADAVGFVIEAGAVADSAKVRKQVQEQARAKYPRARNNLHADNFLKDKPLGNHAVVVTASSSKPGCTGRAMGVGFGQNEAAARKDAERLMGKMFPFNDGKVKVELSKAF
jgi:hypothetical protein